MKERAVRHREAERLVLTDEQAAEVRRRLQEKDPRTFTLAQFEKRLRKRYGP